MQLLFGRKPGDFRLRFGDEFDERVRLQFAVLHFERLNEIFADFDFPVHQRRVDEIHSRQSLEAAGHVAEIVDQEQTEPGAIEDIVRNLGGESNTFSMRTN